MFLWICSLIAVFENKKEKLLMLYIQSYTWTWVELQMLGHVLALWNIREENKNGTFLFTKHCSGIISQNINDRFQLSKKNDNLIPVVNLPHGFHFCVNHSERLDRNVKMAITAWRL